MKQLISFTDKIIGAIVPEDASRIRLLDHTPEYDRQSIIYFAKGKLVGADLMFLPSGKWEIVGEATEKEIGFDPEPFVKNNGWGCYDNYKGIPDNRYTLLTAEKSFYSILASHDIYWVNPMREHFIKKPSTIDAINMDLTENELEILRLDWDKKESNADEMKGNKIIILAKID